MSQSIKATGKVQANIKATRRIQKNKFLQKYNAFLRKIEQMGMITRQTLFKLYAHGKTVAVYENKNIICDAGFAALVAILGNDYGGSGAITEMALGDGVGTPASGDTALFNEVYRNATASSTSFGPTVICTAFYTESEVDGTFTEFGNFVDDTELWSHVNISWTKTDTETLTVQCTYTLANA